MFPLSLSRGCSDAFPACEFLRGEFLTGKSLRGRLWWLWLWGRWGFGWLWVGHCSIQVIDMAVTLSLSSLPFRSFLPFQSLGGCFILS